eukprot:TRINITY_DN2450_c0_g1_i5.p1 TRINITY_DN2450_c0_g1~~TRINITY_DN2450_c0_g1_i5.p1  ORF type:complete len:115 (-),score=28.53 TRINITY_DN2450_c0_g1_i5:210-554(-)
MHAFLPAILICLSAQVYHSLAGIAPIKSKRNDIQYPPEAQAQEISVKITGIEDGSEITEDIPLELSCSVLAVPGLVSVKWYVDRKVKKAGSLVPDGQGIWCLSSDGGLSTEALS